MTTKARRKAIKKLDNGTVEFRGWFVAMYDALPPDLMDLKTKLDSAESSYRRAKSTYEQAQRLGDLWYAALQAWTASKGKP